MEAHTKKIDSIFTGHRIFEIPFYQRSYVWTKDEWSRFLEDMEFISHHNQDYFLGSIIIKQQQTSSNEIYDKRTIIDGQQRFTTLAIFTKVLCLKTNDNETFINHFTVRDKKTKTRTFAILHNQNDRSYFEKVLSLETDIPLEESNNKIIQCYNYFQKNIDIEKLDIDILLAHVVFIGIDLQTQDDEQVIFDTINSLGVRLTTAELLKNFFFTEKSREDYERLWKPIFENDEECIKYWNKPVTTGRTKKSNIDLFFSAFLNIKIQDGDIELDTEHKTIYRRADSLFSNYKDFINTYHINKTDLIHEIIDYAKIYMTNFAIDITTKEICSKPCIERIYFLISVLDIYTMVPYVLYILKKQANIDERNKIFQYLESYTIRRIICKSDNSSYSDLFSENLIGNHILTYSDLKNYLEKKDKNSALVIPSNETVKESLHEIQQPNKRALAVLYLMESRIRSNSLHATKLLAFNQYTLEHLMPVHYEEHWPLNPGYDEEYRRKTINTLGNMTMLPQGLNSSISNSSWKIKINGKENKYGLKAYAADIVILGEIINKSTWNEKTIYKQAERLYDFVKLIWPTSKEDYSIPNPTPRKKEGDKKKNILDTTKYSFDNITFYSKASFVPLFVKKFVEEHSNLSYKEIHSIFNDDLCAKSFKFKGFLCTKLEYDNWDNKYKERRYQGQNEERKIKSSDNIEFFVNTQWTQESMSGILEIAEKYGYTIFHK